MASSAQRRERERAEALRDEVDLFGIGEGTPSDRSRLISAMKSPLHLLLMLRSPDFPLNGGDTLYVNTSGTGQRTGEMTLLEDGQIETVEGVRNSLASAASVYLKSTYEDRPRSSPNGWEVVKVATATPGRYMKLAELFVEYGDRLEAPVDVVEDEDRLEEFMLARGYVSEESVGTYRHTNRKREALS